MFQVSGPVTVELNVNMHCEACADQLKRKILQMRGTNFLLISYFQYDAFIVGSN